MTPILTIIHVAICLVLIIAVLLQSGKAADLAGAFGGGGSQSAFGPRSAQSLLSRLTTACAVLFMFTSLGLWILSSQQTSGSVLSGEEAPPIKEQPAAAATTQPGTQTEEQTAPDKKQTEQKPPVKKDSVPEKKATPPVKK